MITGIIKSALITGLAVAIWTVVLASLLMSSQATIEAIKLDPQQWKCDALDPSDGQCAVYVKNPTQG